MVTPRRSPRRRGFSLIELLIALTITATLMTATLTALDASFKGYKVTTDGASTHVVSRVVMHRITSLVRTGDQFGPYPIDPLDPAQNPVESTFMEFLASEDASTATRTIVRLERREAAQDGPFALWYVRQVFVNNVLSSEESRVLLTNVQQLSFNLEYDNAQVLTRATIDLTVHPDDLGDGSIHGDITAPPLRLVTSVSPRRLR